MPVASETYLLYIAVVIWMIGTTSTQTAEPNKQPLIILDEIYPLHYGLKSDNIQLLDQKTIKIPNFFFDGNAPAAHFLAGKGRRIRANGATNIPVSESQSDDALKSYHGQDITLNLPGDLTFDSFDWLALLSLEQNLGFVFLHKTLPRYPPQIQGFDEKEFKSGPVVLVNETTIFLPNLRFSNQYKDINFWIGNTSISTSESIFLKRGADQLHQGKNVYITFPNGITVEKVQYLGVWDNETKKDLGRVKFFTRNISETIQSNPKARFTDPRTVMIVPKCCPIFTSLSGSGCEEDFTDFAPSFPVFEHNSSHVNNESVDLNLFKFEPYYYSLQCESGKYPLDEEGDDFALLFNGSLIVKSLPVTGILSQGDFCMDNVENDGLLKMLILVCAPAVKISMAMCYAYITLIFLSVICFAGTFILFSFILKCDDIHKKCFIFYTFWMCVTFFLLFITQFAFIRGSGCQTVGFIFQYSMISSFAWLFFLCFDLFFGVLYYSDTMTKGNRIRWYLGISVAVPIISIIISLARNLVPDVPNTFFKPQYGRNTCYFEAESQRSLFFHTPIAFFIGLSIVFLGLTKYQWIINNRSSQSDYFWLDKKQNFNFTFRRYAILVTTMLLWLIDAFLRYNNAGSGILLAVEIIESAQGIVVMLLFVMNKEAKKQINKRLEVLKRRKMRNKRKMQRPSCEVEMLHLDSYPHYPYRT